MHRRRFLQALAAGWPALQHLHAQPVPPSQRVEGIPAGLDAMVLRLLAKEPRERFGYADDVAAALAELGAGDGLAATGPRPRAYLYRPGFAGREEALEQFERHLEHLRSGAGGVVLVGGESGVGKTRLVLEVARQAELRKLQVLAGECTALSVPEAGAAAGLDVAFPRFAYCTDNAAMIGYAGRARLLRGERHSLTLNAVATLPIGVEAEGS